MNSYGTHRLDKGKKKLLSKRTLLLLQNNLMGLVHFSKN